MNAVSSQQRLLARAALASAACVALVGCPGLAQRPPGAYDPSLGAPFDGVVLLDDERVLATDPATLPAVAGACRAPVMVSVVDVRDGDTVTVVPLSEPGPRFAVRLIGVDTPEVAHGPGETDACFGVTSARFMEQLRERVVWLTFDQGCTDRFDRTLAYVWMGAGERDMWQRQLLQRGMARTLSIAPNQSFEAAFALDESTAQAASLGLWSSCP